MNEEEEAVQKTRLSFEDLCRSLNMDEEASNGAWRSYENISKNYTLEVRESCFVLPRARWGHSEVWAGILGLTWLTCGHLNASVGFITKKKHHVCAACLLVVDFRSPSSHRPYLLQHTGLWNGLQNKWLLLKKKKKRIKKYWIWKNPTSHLNFCSTNKCQTKKKNQDYLK